MSLHSELVIFDALNLENKNMEAEDRNRKGKKVGLGLAHELVGGSKIKSYM